MPPSATYPLKGKSDSPSMSIFLETLSLMSCFVEFAVVAAIVESPTSTGFTLKRLLVTDCDVVVSVVIAGPARATCD